jgi:hypothetical protein
MQVGFWGCFGALAGCCLALVGAEVVPPVIVSNIVVKFGL